MEIAGVFEEAYSAKAPGRALFNQMMQRIERGEAEGIVAWAPDRLARNSIDGGRIIYLLDQGIIRNLKFSTFTFENNSQGKFMLQIMFGQSKYYSDALSDNVKRGNRTKVENGWRPNQAPLGYLNNPVTKTIVRDPVHFPLVRRMFELVISGRCTPREVAMIARDEWGFRTPIRNRRGGVPVAMSTVYHMLANPFYAGTIVWNGEEFPGRHEPVLSRSEFERVRQILRRPEAVRRQRYVFPFTGMIRCGACGRQVTAEHKKNRYGYRYVYYHCTRRQLGPRCPEPSIEARELDSQIASWLEQLAVKPEFEAWADSLLCGLDRDLVAVESARRQSLARSLCAVSEQLNELTGLRLRRMVSDEEFAATRSRLQAEQSQLQTGLNEAAPLESRIEPTVSGAVLLLGRAGRWFSSADDEGKRLILKTVGSNLLLSAGKVSIEPAKPLCSMLITADRARQLADVYDVRTFLKRAKADPLLRKCMEDTYAALREPESEEFLRNVTKLREMFDPDSIAPPVRRRRAA